MSSRREVVRPSLLVFVVPAHPELASAVLVASLWDEVEVVVGRVQQVDPARVRRVRVEDVPALVPEEDAHPLALRPARAQAAVVVDRARLVFGRERHAVVEVEVVLRRRDPREAPTHPLLVREELGERRARDRNEGHVPRVHVDDVGVEVVGPERAALAAGVVVRSEHEVVDDELAPALEELGEGPLAVRRVEDVLLLDAFPRQRAPLFAQLVAEPGELLLLRQQRRACLDPLVVLNNLVLAQDFLLDSFTRPGRGTAGCAPPSAQRRTRPAVPPRRSCLRPSSTPRARRGARSGARVLRRPSSFRRAPATPSRRAPHARARRRAPRWARRTASPSDASRARARLRPAAAVRLRARRGTATPCPRARHARGTRARARGPRAWADGALRRDRTLRFRAPSCSGTG